MGCLVSKEDYEHISHLKCSAQGPLPLRRFHRKGRKNKPLKLLVFHAETNVYRKQIFNSPPMYSVGVGGFTVEYSKGNYIQGTLAQKHFLFDTTLAAAVPCPFSRCAHYAGVGRNLIWETLN